MRKTTIPGVGLSLFAAAGAAAQQGEMIWSWDVSYSDPAGEINSTDDTVSAVLNAQFNSGMQFAGANLDVTSDGLSAGDFEGVGNFATGTAGNPLLGSITNVDGTISGDDIADIDAAQSPIDINPGGMTSNPVEVFRLTWTTDDLSPREINVSTANHDSANVYTDTAGTNVPLESVPGSFGITVTPTPGTVALLGTGGLLAWRRRR